jgi:hypothetical protein
MCTKLDEQRMCEGLQFGSEKSWFLRKVDLNASHLAQDPERTECDAGGGAPAAGSRVRVQPVQAQASRVRGSGTG